MSRQKMIQLYRVGPKREEALHLAKKVFGLKKKLGITYEQMSQETGRSVSTLASLYSDWVSGHREHAWMNPHVANALIKFWNLHLENSRRQPKISQKKSKAPAPSATIIDGTAVKINSSLKADSARELVALAVKIQQDKKISAKAMAKMMGCDMKKLQKHLYDWHNEKSTTYGKFKKMESRVVERFLNFVRLHLDQPEYQRLIAKLFYGIESVKATEMAKVPKTGNIYLEALLHKCGRAKAIELLAEAGKLAKYMDELKLTTEELVNLV